MRAGERDRLERLLRCLLRPSSSTRLYLCGIVDFRELFEKPYRICYRVHGRDAVIVSVLDGRRDLERALIDRALGR